jgi:hypothetical protein
MNLRNLKVSLNQGKIFKRTFYVGQKVKRFVFPHVGHAVKMNE